MVRFVNVAPNAIPEEVVLTDLTRSLVIEEFAGVEYLETTEYVSVLAGTYEVTLTMAVIEGEELDRPVQVPAQTLDMFAGEFYTVALIGLQFPDEPTAADEGFFAWLEELFTAGRQDLSLHAMVVDDLVATVILPHEAEVRIMHAAPGTDAVDVVFVRDAVTTVDVLETVSYGHTGGFRRIIPEAGRVQVRMAGSDVVLLDLAGETFEPGISHTVFVAGTPIEDVPIDALVVANPWVAAEAIPPAAPGAVMPATATLTANEIRFLRDHVEQVTLGLEALEAHLARIAEIEEAEDEAAAAREELARARAALERAQMQLDMVTPPVVAPGLPTTDPEGEPEPAD